MHADEGRTRRLDGVRRGADGGRERFRERGERDDPVVRRALRRARARPWWTARKRPPSVVRRDVNSSSNLAPSRAPHRPAVSPHPHTHRTSGFQSTSLYGDACGSSSPMSRSPTTAQRGECGIPIVQMHSREDPLHVCVIATIVPRACRIRRTSSLNGDVFMIRRMAFSAPASVACRIRACAFLSFSLAPSTQMLRMAAHIASRMLSLRSLS